MTAVSIRPAVPADEAAIARLHALSWVEAYRGILSDAYLDGEIGPQMQARWQGLVETPEPGRLILVATLAGHFAGFLIARPDPADPAWDMFESLHVQPEFRAQGVGAALMREGADRLAAMGRGRAVLWVVEANRRARAFYARLGGAEEPIVHQKIGGQGPVPLVPVRWQDLSRIASLARAELLRRLAPPKALGPAEIREILGKHIGAPHPVMAQHAKLREKRRIGDPFGLTDFGVNLVEIPPGGWSSIPHAHSHEDEFIFMLDGALVLVTGDEERLLEPGACAGFPGGGWPHHLQNRSEKWATFLEIGARKPDRDTVDYPGEDLRVDRRPDGSRGFVRRDGTPVDEMW